MKRDCTLSCTDPLRTHTAISVEDCPQDMYQDLMCIPTRAPDGDCQRGNSIQLAVLLQQRTHFQHFQHSNTNKVSFEQKSSVE